jgi:membrane associated rhomboid family serine protease
MFFPLRDVNPRTRTPIVNWLLIIANIIVFVISLAGLEQFVIRYGFTPADFSWFTVFTSMFLHGGFAHLFGNMWFLYIFGDNVEDAMGHVPYLIFYLLAGIAATLSHYLLNLGSTIPAVGASGAISGVLGAYLVLFPKAEVYVSGGMARAGKVSAKIMLLAWFGFQLLSAALAWGGNAGIAFFAHIGGFIFGVLFAWIYRLVRGQPRP